MKEDIYCAAIKHGDEVEWDFAWERYQKIDVATEKKTILKALSCSEDIWILNRYVPVCNRK